MSNTLEDLTLLDVTLRDGGYVNKHSWSLPQAVAVVDACVRAGIDHVEVGYIRPRRDSAGSPAASCPPEYLAALRERMPDTTTMVVMAHMADVDIDVYQRLADLGVGLVRLPAKLSTIDAVAPHVAAAHAAGMRAAVNLIRVSQVGPDGVTHAAATAHAAGADIFYVADSNGSLFPEGAAEVVRTARAAAPGTAIGFHAHDGLSFAFGNSLEAARTGCAFLDASLCGMGKGGGNLSMELIAGYLRANADRAFDIAVLAEASAEILKPWIERNSRSECESIVTSLLNLNMDDIEALRGDSSDLTSLLSDRILSS
ncbi:4-hydroxy-2-oxovalerate aldolase [Alloactinosynnema sp. L-07]|uniref:hypothetical protein n=1 Tax=Alloactinosynnema sp. L-07 TaxID=1653480 RepID=UPI00065F05A6|nr:hypothetical protein [Alloactinosynnema sp. L-07]CRK57279.1 4-hydroxy-2-oxovalerate aldolase [Alloactinosynnema sp. L-07]